MDICSKQYYTLQELADRYQVTPQSIKAALTRLSIKRLPKPDIYKTLKEDYEAGSTIAELAEKYNVSYRAVWQAMSKRDIKRRSKARRNQLGKNNPAWRGDKASYFAMHRRVRKLRGTPQECSECKRTDLGTKYHWASLTKDFGNPLDYIRLCVSCHAKHDKWVEHITK